ncbi:hypothetical protein ABZ135_36070 [Streptomyces sp. NPDC006339]|uniref:hypothetical protein n=1 Tax=Streptomyces sp. NPDC006339 TaxID=3156755 RepID=UPI0033B05454
MAAHAAIPDRRGHRTHGGQPGRRTRQQTGTHGWGLPVALGIVYGLYAPTVVRRGGEPSWGQFWLGVVSGLVLAVAVYALRRYGRALPRELRAAAWGGLAGIAIGFLYSLADRSVYAATTLGLVVAGAVTAAAFYLFYTHEDASGRPAPY